MSNKLVLGSFRIKNTDMTLSEFYSISGFMVRGGDIGIGEGLVYDPVYWGVGVNLWCSLKPRFLKRAA